MARESRVERRTMTLGCVQPAYLDDNHEIDS